VWYGSVAPSVSDQGRLPGGSCQGSRAPVSSPRLLAGATPEQLETHARRWKWCRLLDGVWGGEEKQRGRSVAVAETSSCVGTSHSLLPAPLLLWVQFQGLLVDWIWRVASRVHALGSVRSGSS